MLQIMNNYGNMATGFRNLMVYKKASAHAMDIFELTKEFPKEERYALTTQIRNSSRSVCSNIGEGYRKRRYPACFKSKASDADMENTETQVWFDFALACKYIEYENYNDLNNRAEEIGNLQLVMSSRQSPVYSLQSTDCGLPIADWRLLTEKSLN